MFTEVCYRIELIKKMNEIGLQFVSSDGYSDEDVGHAEQVNEASKNHHTLSDILRIPDG